MFSYTLINGECPISYLSKLLLYKNYEAGQNITYYPEMMFIFPNKTYITHYFTTNTILYLFSLLHVIIRQKISLIILSIPFSTLLIYFLFVHNLFWSLSQALDRAESTGSVVYRGSSSTAIPSWIPCKINKNHKFFIVYQKYTQFILFITILYNNSLINNKFLKI
jgi:hypothetical protein